MKDLESASLFRTMAFLVLFATLLSSSGFAVPPATLQGEELDPVPATAGGNPGINYSTGFEPGEGFSLGYISNSGGTPAGCGGVAFPCWGHTTSNTCPSGAPGQNCNFSVITPTIENVHPASGAQHLRLTHDPTTRTNIPGLGLAVDARYPRSSDLLARPVAANTVSLDMAISNAGGMNFRIQPQSNSQGLPATNTLFFYMGGIYVADDCGGGFGFLFTGVNWDTTGDYHNYMVTMDPYEDAVGYYYDGVLIHSSCVGVVYGTNLERLLIFGDNFPGSTMDVDNVVMEAASVFCGDGIVQTPNGEQCEPGVAECAPGTVCNSSCRCVTVCGDGIIAGSERCEPGNNPTGCNPGHSCGAVGTTGQCACDYLCTEDEPCEITSGSNGPFYSPLGDNSGGFFRYLAPPGIQAVSVELCGSTGVDQWIFRWGSCTDPNDGGSANDDCLPGNSGVDPTASCYGTVHAPNYESCTCHDNPRAGDNCFLLQTQTPQSGQIMITISNKAGCFGSHVGACCDTNGAGAGICTDNTTEDDCTGPDKIWTDQGKCADQSCVCIPDCTGRTCGGDGCEGGCGNCNDQDICNGSETCNANGTCDLGAPLNCDDGNACNGLETCNPQAACVPGTPLSCSDGLACNGFETCNPSSGCVAGTPVNCDDGIDCTVDTCNEPSGSCSHDNADCAIPTTSQWGLVALALLLLIAAKAQFRRVRRMI